MLNLKQIVGCRPLSSRRLPNGNQPNLNHDPPTRNGKPRPPDRQNRGAPVEQNQTKAPVFIVQLAETGLYYLLSQVCVQNAKRRRREVAPALGYWFAATV